MMTRFGKAGASANSSISTRSLLPELTSTISLDPVSLITLFFDAPEKELMRRSGDMTWVCCLGLFVNPTTTWTEYGTLYPGQGVRYYNPERKLTSTIEVEQVHNYITRLADGRKEIGITVTLHPRSTPRLLSVDWVLIRPLALFCIAFVAIASLDYLAIGALCSLLIGQAIVVIYTIKQRVPKFVDQARLREHNVFFLANNVTVLVKSNGLFVQTCSSSGYTKAEKPVAVETISTLIFMTGILLLSTATLNSKLAYLLGHALQAILLAFHSSSAVSTRTLNNVTWRLEPTVKKGLKRRRHAYVWITRETTGNTDWLRLYDLATAEVLEYVETEIRRRIESYNVYH